MKQKISARLSSVLAVLTILITFVTLIITDCAPQPVRFNIDNPYSNVDWTDYGRYKANMHTHTTAGEADASPETVIDLYSKLGYSILALTDHDDNVTAATTWPWSLFKRDPGKLGMIAIQGNEISEVNHIGSHFNDYGNPEVPS